MLFFFKKKKKAIFFFFFYNNCRCSQSFLIKTADKNLETMGLLLAVPSPGKSPSKTLGSIISHLLAVVPEKLGGSQT